MKVKQCQFNAAIRCENRGEACLTTAQERQVYNEVICQMQEKLETMKLPEVDNPDARELCSGLDDAETVDIDFDELSDEDTDE